MEGLRLVVLDSASLDGKLAISPERPLLYGDERWQVITSQGQFDALAWLRAAHRPGAILEGSGSFLAEGAAGGALPAYAGDPAPLYADYLPQAVVGAAERRGWFTVVDGRGRVRFAVKEWPGEEWRGWWPLILTARGAPPEYLSYLQREEIPYLVAGEEHVDLAQALRKLHDALGVSCVLSTAGGRLNGALLRAGLVDEVNVLFEPGIIGGRAAPHLFDCPDLAPGEMPTRLRLLSAHVQAGGGVWLRYEVLRD